MTERANRFIEAFETADAAFDAQFSEVSDAVESIEEAVDIPTLYDVLMQIEQVLENVAQMMGSAL